MITSISQTVVDICWRKQLSVTMASQALTTHLVLLVLLAEFYPQQCVSILFPVMKSFKLKLFISNLSMGRISHVTSIPATKYLIGGSYFEMSVFYSFCSEVTKVSGGGGTVFKEVSCSFPALTSPPTRPLFRDIHCFAAPTIF